MRVSIIMSNVIIKCSIIGHVASWSIPGDQHNKLLHSKRQNNPPYSWEQTWKSESKNQVTTVTTATSGVIPPGTGFNQGAANVWSYQYSYSSTYDDNFTAASKNSLSESSHAIPPNLSSMDTSITSYAIAADTSNNPSVAYTSPKPKHNASKPIQHHVTGKPGSTTTKPGYNRTKPGYINIKPGYTSTDVRHNNLSISRTPGRLRPPSNTTTVSGTVSHVTGSHRHAWLALHNNYRSQYGVGSVTWSEELVPTAQRQVEKCIWKHTQNNHYGENIAAGQSSASDVVVAWVEGPNEREIWNPDSATPTHFTQVVWKETKQIACASKSCETVEGSNLPQSPVTLWACEYHPKGNVRGEYVQNVLAASGGKPLASAATSASVSVDPDNPNAAKAGSRSATGFF